MKKAILFLLALFGMGAIAVVIASNTKGVTFSPLPDGRTRMAQISSQERILKEGDKLVEGGFYMQALSRYEEGLGSRFIAKDEDKRGPIVRKIRLYRATGDFKAGLDEFNNAPAILGLDPEFKLQLEVLQNWKETGKKQSVYDYINHLKFKYENSLPPKGYDTFSSIPIADIILLYDAIGDYDAGIAYIDEILNWTFQVDRSEFQQLRAQIQTAQQATECAGLDVFPVTKRHPNWSVCKWLREYLLVREGFEQDKAEGFKGCAGKKPGEECVGHAMRALIKSDYFPW